MSQLKTHNEIKILMYSKLHSTGIFNLLGMQKSRKLTRHTLLNIMFNSMYHFLIIAIFMTLFTSNIFSLNKKEKDMQVLQTLEPQHATPYNDGFENDRKKFAKHEGIQCVEDKAHRVFEMGVSLDFTASNNIMGLDDILTKHVVFNFPEMEDTLDGKDFSLGLTFLPTFFINLNLKNGVHVGLNTGLETYGSLQISNDLFELLGSGNSPNEKISFDIDASGDAFYFIGLGVGFDFKGYHLEIKPAVYIPIMHLQTEHTNINFYNDKTGSVTSSVHAEIALYSAFNLEDIFDGGFSADSINLNSGWGFDLETSLDHEIVHNLVGSIYSRLPIVPGYLSYMMRKPIDLFMYMDPLTNGIYDDERGDNTDFSFSFESGDNIYKSVTYKQHRPFKMGTRVAWRPLTNWFTLGALLGFAVSNPYTSDPHAYVEYSLIANVDVYAGRWNKSIVSLHLSTSYQNEMFTHKAVFGLNLRAIEIDVGISACSPDFVQSFHGGGLGAFVMFAFGW